MNLFAQSIYLARLEKGLSQKELAQKAGIPQPNLSKIEKGRDFKVSTLTQIALALEVSVEDLIRGKEVPEVDKKRLFQRENIEKAVSYVVRGEKGPQKLRPAIELISNVARKTSGAYVSRKNAHLHWYQLRQIFSDQEIDAILSRIEKARGRG